MRFLLRFWLLMPVPLLLSQLAQSQGVLFSEQTVVWFSLTPLLLVLYQLRMEHQQNRKHWQRLRGQLLADEFLLDPKSSQDREHAAKLKLGARPDV
jgi:hypothetical protein